MSERNGQRKISISKFFEYVKKLNTKVNQLWQSHNKNLNKKGILVAAMIFWGMSILLLFSAVFTDIFLIKVVYVYVSVGFVMLAITMGVSYPYIYSKRAVSGRVKKLSQFLYKLLLLICLVANIITIIVFKFIEKIVKYRAKKFDNFEMFWIILIIDVCAIMGIFPTNLYISGCVVTYIVAVLQCYFGFTISAYPSILFLIILLSKIEMDLITKIILRIIKQYKIYIIDKEILKKQRDIPRELSADIDIQKYLENKKGKIDDYQNKKWESLDYDLGYQKRTLWKFQLLCLIIIFSIATFAPSDLFESQSDTINVITVFTLIMLYIDKRKEWK